MQILEYLKNLVTQNKENMWLVTCENDNEIRLGINAISEINAMDIADNIEEEFGIEVDCESRWYEKETKLQAPDFYFIVIEEAL